MLPTMQFGGRSNRATWQYPGVGVAQYMTGQPVIGAQPHFSAVPAEPSGCQRLYVEERGKTWYSHDPTQCANVYSNINCPSGHQAFQGRCGCGCEPEQALTHYLCGSDARKASCGYDVAPVCGSKSLSGDRAINVTFLNSCAACKDPNVGYYTKGRC